MTFKLNPFHQTFQDHLKQWLTPEELVSWNRYNDSCIRVPFVSHRWEPEDWTLWEQQQLTIRKAMTNLELKAMHRKVIKPEQHSYPCDCEICASRWVGVDENGET